MTWHKTPDMKWEELTQQQWKWAIQDLLQNSDTALQRAVIHIYNRQEFDEQQGRASMYHNNAGFNQKDAHIMTGIAEHLLAKGSLTVQQKQIARDRMPKYWRQLMIISKANLDITDRQSEYSLYDVYNDEGEMILRYCKVCKTSQPLSNFYSTHSAHGGDRVHYLRTCKKCVCRRKKEERARNKPVEPAIEEKHLPPTASETTPIRECANHDVYENGKMVKRYCQVCKRVRPIKDFYCTMNAQHVITYRRTCKYCLAMERG